jgi:CRP-like cAMP-binding protein
MASWAKKQKAELLAQMPLFSTCSKRQLAQVTSFTVADQLPAGSILTRQGAAGGIAYILASGQAEVLRGGRRLALLGPGDVVGELSLIDGKPRSATVKAVTDLEVLEIDARDLSRLLRTAPAVSRNLLAALAERLRRVDALLPTAGL